MLVLVTGGARSGKSKFAESYTAHLASEAIYVATAQIYDDEMQHRMEMHQVRREQSGYAWTTIAEPYELAQILDRLNLAETKQVILIDCMTLWLSNWLLKWLDTKPLNNKNAQNDRIQQLANLKLEELMLRLVDYKGTVLIVTNEVGDGIVPEYPLGRLYRDLAGIMNQRLAALCDQVFLVTAGIPIELKHNAFRF
jgi:adenosylcobinamide kinase / adenosylcobinamide-phosphate guanylyltransferase